MPSNYYNSFVTKLKEIFMMDHAELDFGIYRIMNQKRQDIMRFFEVELLPQVNAVLSANAGNTDSIRKRMTEIEAQLGADLASLPDTIPLVAEYKRLKTQLGQTVNTEEMQAEVFSHLTTFFSRYYDNGDFISKRRYKDNTYAIPYNGEEVKLYWANADQYYIKTSEYFRNYTFILPISQRKVHFVLKDASTEQNNNKAGNNMERRFALFVPQEEEDTICEQIAEGELNIYFTYEPMPKATKQKDLLAQAMETLGDIIPTDFNELLTAKAPTKENANRTLLEKHLTDYTAKNSFDYFIHKDLGGFLHRELDFYIKNEVLYIDDLDSKYITSQLTIVRAIKQVGEKIIRMLAQLENFQKRLWLKKKFVVQCDYCITIDRVPESLYPEIIANDKQREEWVRLFAIDEIKRDALTEGYSEPLTMKFLKQNPFLVLDTAFFSASFKHQLLASLENVDEQMNGLLIKSDNYHALRILENIFDNSIDGIYIDPPYNTGSDGFIYKDNFRHSSWLAMMENRLNIAHKLMADSSSITVSINENELFNLKNLLDILFDGNYYTTLTVRVRHEDRILKGDKDFHEVYENVLFYSKTKHFKPLKRKKDNTSIEDYRFKVEVKNPDFTLQLGNKEVEVYSPQSYNIRRMERPSVDYLKRISVRGSIREGNSSGRFYVAFIENKAMEYPGYLFKVSNIGEDGLGYRFFWTPSKESGRKNGDYYQGKPQNAKDIMEIPYPNYIDFEKDFNDATNEGGIPYRNGKKPINFLNHILSLQKIAENKSARVLDFFAGSASSGHAVITLNRKDKGTRRYILVQNEDIFDQTTKPRMGKAIYSEDWKDGKPVSRKGISQCFKYIRLEQYEDTLNNLRLKKMGLDFKNDEFHESYMLDYMLDTEAKDSLMNLKLFVNPFAVTLKTTQDNELTDTPVDLVETFNYLIGLNVETIGWHLQDNICVVQGKTHRDGLRTLVIWRNRNEVNNEQLERFFEEMNFRTRDTEFDIIYVNGDNMLPNLRRDEEHWKVMLTEEEFAKRMFEEE